jgi:hypothetical protein
MNRVWMPSLYALCEGNTPDPSWAGRSTGVQVHSMLPKSGKGTEELQIRVITDDEADAQEVIFKSTKHIPDLDVRWSHSSEEAR